MMFHESVFVFDARPAYSARAGWKIISSAKSLPFRRGEGEACAAARKLRASHWLHRKQRRTPEQVLTLCDEPRYEGFGPTPMAEQLLKAMLVVDHKTVRRWRIAKGKHTVRPREQKHREWREPRACFGRDGADGRIAPRLVRGSRAEVHCH
jgi:hypothetical protein